MDVDLFDFTLPPESIAQRPVEPRDAARLFAHAVGADRTHHRRIADLPELLEPGDLLVVNDTRVLAARLGGQRASGGRVEVLLVEREGALQWRALLKPAARIRPGEVLSLEQGALRLVAMERPMDGVDGGLGSWRVRLEADGDEAPDVLLARFGRMPLPPYIRRAADASSDDERGRDAERYQTVFARAPGAVAAPTAGLHFTPKLLAALEARGVLRASVTLHVGQGTFQPVAVADTDQHVMHAESYELPEATVQAVAACRARGGRVVAVGTTSVRVLESCCDDGGKLTAGSGSTCLFLTPGSRLRAVDALLTNFHLPRSTLLMLVATFAGTERILRLYTEAVEQGYRFYSYGDAMLLTER